MDISSLVEQIATIGAALAGVFLAIVKSKDALASLVDTKPVLRKTIRADLELFKLMEENDPGYEELKVYIKGQVQTMIKKDEKKELVSKNWLNILFGLLMTGGFGYWTYHIVASPQISNWWTILTVWMTLAGFGFFATAFKKPTPNRDDSADDENHTAISNLPPDILPSE